MSDLISRQAAIDALVNESQSDGAYGYIDTKSIICMLNDLPSVQPDVPDRNVGDLISREAMGDAVNRIRLSKNETWYSFYQKVLNELCKLPSADVVERKHGKWIMHIDDLVPVESTMECSECHHEQSLIIDDNFCPNCGTKMDEEGGAE